MMPQPIGMGIRGAAMENGMSFVEVSSPPVDLQVKDAVCCPVRSVASVMLKEVSAGGLSEARFLSGVLSIEVVQDCDCLLVEILKSIGPEGYAWFSIGERTLILNPVSGAHGSSVPLTS